MRDYPNIEKSSFAGRQYVGYAGGKVWNITGDYGNWRANVRRCADSDPVLVIHARTLADLSVALEHYDD